MMVIKTLRTAFVLACAAWSVSGHVQAQDVSPLPDPTNQGEQIDQTNVDPEEDTGAYPQDQSDAFLDDEDEALSPQDILDLERTMERPQ